MLLSDREELDNDLTLVSGRDHSRCFTQGHHLRRREGPFQLRSPSRFGALYWKAVTRGQLLLSLGGTQTDGKRSSPSSMPGLAAPKDSTPL